MAGCVGDRVGTFGPEHNKQFAERLRLLANLRQRASQAGHAECEPSNWYDRLMDYREGVDSGLEPPTPPADDPDGSVTLTDVTKQVSAA